MGRDESGTLARLAAISSRAALQSSERFGPTNVTDCQSVALSQLAATDCRISALKAARRKTLN
jgi:hypothetical protein